MAIALETGITFEIEIASWDIERVTNDLHRNDFVVVTSSGHWRASFSSRNEALYFADQGDVLLCHDGLVVIVTQRSHNPRRY